MSTNISECSWNSCFERLSVWKIDSLKSGFSLMHGTSDDTDDFCKSD